MSNDPLLPTNVLLLVRMLTLAGNALESIVFQSCSCASHKVFLIRWCGPVFCHVGSLICQVQDCVGMDVGMSSPNDQDNEDVKSSSRMPDVLIR